MMLTVSKSSMGPKFIGLRSGASISQSARETDKLSMP